jgi:hypothetical protein
MSCGEKQGTKQQQLPAVTTPWWALHEAYQVKYKQEEQLDLLEGGVVTKILGNIALVCAVRGNA